LTFASRSIRLAVAHVARESSPPRLDYEAERDIATWSSRLFDEIAVGESASYARTLIVLTSHADNARTREASIAIMVLLAHSRRDQLGLR